MTARLDDALLAELKRGGFVHKGHFRFSSNRHSDVLLDMAHVTTDPDTVSHLSYAIAKRFFTVNVHTVAAPSIQGAGLALWVANYLDPKARVIPAEMVEGRPVVPEPLRDLAKGRRVLIVDDIIVNGDLVLPLAESVLAAGGDVIGIATLWNAGEPTLGGAPVFGLLNTAHDLWPADRCPLCANDVPLTEAGV